MNFAREPDETLRRDGQCGQRSTMRTVTLPFGPVTAAHSPQGALPFHSGMSMAATSRSLGVASKLQAPSPVAS